MFEGRDEAAGVDLEELVGFFVRVDFEVLVRDAFDFKRYPDTLNKGANNEISLI